MAQNNASNNNAGGRRSGKGKTGAALTVAGVVAALLGGTYYTSHMHSERSSLEENLSAQTALLEAESHRFGEEIEALKGRLGETSGQLEEARMALKAVADERDAGLDATDRLTATLDGTKRELESKLAELATVQASLNEHQTALDEARLAADKAGRAGVAAKADIDRLTGELEVGQAERADLRSTVTSLESETQALKSARTRAQAEIEALQAQLNGASQDNERRSQAVADQVRTLLKERDRLVMEKLALERNVERLSRSLDAVRADVGVLAVRLQESGTRSVELDAKLALARAQIEQTTASLDKRNRRVEVLENEKIALERRLDEMTAMLADADGAPAEQSDQADEIARQQLISAREAITRRQDELETELKEARLAIDRLEAEQVELTEMVALLENDLGTRTEEVRKAEAELAGRETALATLELQAETAANALVDARQALERSSVDVSALKAQRIVEDSQRQLLIDERDRLSLMIDERDRLSLMIADLAGKLDVLQNESAQNNQAMAEQVAALTGERDALSAMVAAGDIERDRFAAERTVLQASIAELSAMTNTGAGEIAELTSEIDRLNGDVVAGRSESASLRSKASNMVSELKGVRAEAKSAEAALASLKSDLADALSLVKSETSQSDLTKADNEQLRGEISLREERVENLEGETEDLFAQLQIKDARNTSLQTTLVTVEDELRRAMLEIDKLERTTGLAPERVDITNAVATVPTSRLLREELTFWFDGDELSAEQLAAIGRVAAELEYWQARRISVVGYTDTVGEPAYNIDLSARRARAVAEALRSLGAESAAWDVRGVGSQEPTYSNDTLAGRRANRRVVITAER